MTAPARPLAERDHRRRACSTRRAHWRSRPGPTPTKLAQWWGPKGFTNPVVKSRQRVGGAIRIHMRSPDGIVYPMKGEISRDRSAGAALSLPTSSRSTMCGLLTLSKALTVVTFAEHDGKTKLTVAYAL